MPYINRTVRKEIDQYLGPLFAHIKCLKIGDLNYVISRIIDTYVEYSPCPSYQGYNEIIGVLECIKAEYYRRRLVPYEDEKIKNNGDIFLLP